MAGWRWRRLGVAVTQCVVGCCAPCRGGVGVGGSWGLACHIEAAWQGLARHVEVAWRVGGVLCDVAGSWHVLGQGGGLVCHVEVAWQGLAHRVEVTWRGLGVCWVGVVVSRRVAGGRVLRAMSGWREGRWRLGLACHIEAAWRVGGVLACHVGLVRWVGGGGAGWRGFAFSRVLCAVLGWRGGLAVAGCWGRMEVACMHKWPATSKVLRAVLGWRVGGGGVLGWGRMEAARVHEGTAMACNVEGQLILSHILYLA
ncbi:hypothetical protein EDB89DRAFT_1917233 [Lactarius sanguifluus]|nr:hypothetical protein EDB89DRAFT_1917233 [Lactarius sanguifluus]